MIRRAALGQEGPLCAKCTVGGSCLTPKLSEETSFPSLELKVIQREGVRWRTVKRIADVLVHRIVEEIVDEVKITP